MVMDPKSQRNLKNMFRTGVGLIADDSDYYAKIFNVGLRVLNEIDRNPTHVAYSELLHAFEKYCEWNKNEQIAKNTRMSIIRCIVDLDGPAPTT